MRSKVAIRAFAIWLVASVLWLGACVLWNADFAYWWRFTHDHGSLVREIKDAEAKELAEWQADNAAMRKAVNLAVAEFRQSEWAKALKQINAADDEAAKIAKATAESFKQKYDSAHRNPYFLLMSGSDYHYLDQRPAGGRVPYAPDMRWTLVAGLPIVALATLFAAVVLLLPKLRQLWNSRALRFSAGGFFAWAASCLFLLWFFAGHLLEDEPWKVVGAIVIPPVIVAYTTWLIRICRRSSAPR